MRVFLMEADSRANYLAGGTSAANPNDGTSFPRILSTNCSLSNDNILTLGLSNHGLQAGDIIMDSNGNEHLITDVSGAQLTVLNNVPTSPLSPSTVWYAPPYGASSSPARGVVTVSIDVDPAP